MSLILSDVFLTVLYARLGTGILSPRLARILWWVFGVAAHATGRRRGRMLSFCGPAIVVFLVVIWACGLTCGAALIMHGSLGRSILSSSGNTPADYSTALYAAGSSLSIVGSGNFSPTSPAMRLFYLFNSLVGMSVLSLTLTYLMQIYSAIQQRNALGLKIQLLTGWTGDAARLLQGLGPAGNFDSAGSVLSDLGGAIASLKETHHLYPVLLYFRFDQPFYSVSFITMMALDTAALIESSLDRERYGSLIGSSALWQLHQGSVLLLKTLLRAESIKDVPSAATDPVRHEQWARRYAEALTTLQRAGVQTRMCISEGADEYIRMRSEWNDLVLRLLRYMQYSVGEIDPASGGRSATAGDE